MEKNESAFARFMKRYQDGPKALMRGKYICAFLFTIVPIIHFFVFYIGQNYLNFYLAFTRFVGISAVDGSDVYKFSLENFSSVWKMLSQGDSGLMIALKNTGILFVIHALQLAFNFVIAYTFAQKLRGAAFFRVAIYLPTIISGLVLSVAVKNVFAPDGPISVIIQRSGGSGLFDFFHDDNAAYPALMIYCVWVGFYQDLLIFEGAIRRVPQEVLESGKLDGIKSAAQELWLLIIPIMWDTISTIILLSICSLFTISAPILLFTDGQYNTQTLNFWFYAQVQYNGSSANALNVSAAVGIVVTLINLPIVYGSKWLLAKVTDSIEY